MKDKIDPIEFYDYMINGDDSYKTLIDSENNKSTRCFRDHFSASNDIMNLSPDDDCPEDIDAAINDYQFYNSDDALSDRMNKDESMIFDLIKIIEEMASEVLSRSSEEDVQEFLKFKTKKTLSGD